MYGLVDWYGKKLLAQRFYNGLPALLKHFMGLYDSLHKHTPDIRDDYHALQKEVRNVKQWRPFTDALAQLSKAKAFRPCQQAGQRPLGLVSRYAPEAHHPPSLERWTRIIGHSIDISSR